MSNWLPRSLRWRLQAWLALLLLVVLTGFGIAVYQLERVNRVNRIDADLATRLAALNNDIRNAPFSRGGSTASVPARRPPPKRSDSDSTSLRHPPPGPPPPGPRPKGPPPGPPPGGPRPASPPPGRPPDDQPRPAAKPKDLAMSPDAESQFSVPYYYVVWYRDGTVLKGSSGAPSDVPAPTLFERDTLTHWRTRRDRRETFHCSGFGDCALAGRSMAGNLNSLRTFGLGLFGAGAAALALALGVGWWLIGRAIRPIRQIGEAANRISSGNLSERVPVVDEGNELGLLGRVLNSTFARLEAAFSRQRQFTADAAHELRTPLAVMIVEAQTALSRPRDAAEYRETVEAFLETAQQMRALTESMLTLARADAAEDALPRSPVDLMEMARAVSEGIRPLAQAKAIRMHSELAPATVFCNPDRLIQLITNLIRNAIDYNRPDGEVRISTSSTPEGTILTIADSGIGIAATDLPHIFERFYRVDKSRSSARGHVGLGLAICKTFVEAEHGIIEVSSELNVGTVFTVRFPQRQA